MTQAEKMTNIIAKFVGHTAKKLPDDVIAKLQELRAKEDSPMAKVIYDTMFRNQELAVKLDRPSCQDTGVLQFWVKCGMKFPLIDDLEALLKEAVIKATFETPLRHNSVETFDEYNTGKNVGKGTPTVFWDIVTHSDKCEIYTYMAGGGCTLPGHAMVLMPEEGYEGVTKFVLDRMTTYGLNACPMLLVGVGSHNPNELAAKMEKLLEDGINAIGLGPQGMGGNYAVMGVNIENTARHPSAIGVAVNVGCWSHRRVVEEGREIPVDVRNNAILHAGPIIRPIDPDNGKFEYEFVKTTEVRVIVGKGGMKEKTANACKDFGCIHCVTPAGNAVVAAVCVEEIVKAEWRDLGMHETLWNCRVK